jgi:antitoxin YefM
VNAITYTAARENLAQTMTKVCENHEPVIITRNRDQAVVMMSLEDYSALDETAYLTRSPANAKRLREAIAQVEKGKGIRKKLSDLKD